MIHTQHSSFLFIFLRWGIRFWSIQGKRWFEVPAVTSSTYPCICSAAKADRGHRYLYRYTRITNYRTICLYIYLFIRLKLLENWIADLLPPFLNYSRYYDIESLVQIKMNYLELLCGNNEMRVLRWEHQMTWYTLRIDRWYSHSAKTGGLFWEKQCTAVALEQYIQS
jgi:hypothetical protein